MESDNLRNRLIAVLPSIFDRIADGDFVEWGEMADVIIRALEPQPTLQPILPPLARAGAPPESGAVCGSCGHGTRSQVHEGINGKGETGLCLRMTHASEGDPGAIYNPVAGRWVVRCDCSEWIAHD